MKKFLIFLSNRSFKTLYFLSDIAYYLIYYIVGYRKKIVRKNLVNSFPEKSLDEIKVIEKKFYRQFCDQIMEMIKMFTLSAEEMAKHFKNRTQSDINEELFVTEFAKYITNQPSALNSLSSQELEEISYNVHRLLDSILMGAHSSNLYENQVYEMSMKELAQRLDSTTMNNDFFERVINVSK